MKPSKASKASKAHAQHFVAEIDIAELAVRLLERGCHMKRPPGATGRAAWEQIERLAATGQIPEDIVRDFEAMAQIAIAYFGECIETMQRQN